MKWSEKGSKRVSCYSRAVHPDDQGSQIKTPRGLHEAWGKEPGAKHECKEECAEGEGSDREPGRNTEVLAPPSTKGWPQESWSPAALGSGKDALRKGLWMKAMWIFHNCGIRNRKVSCKYMLFLAVFLRTVCDILFPLVENLFVCMSALGVLRLLPQQHGAARVAIERLLWDCHLCKFAIALTL